MIKRKKVCKSCGRKLWLREFYPERGECKECICARRRVEYRESHPSKDGVRMGKDGHLKEHKGSIARIYWGEQKLRDFKRLFPIKSNDDLVITFGVSLRTLIRKARELGLSKSSEYISHQCRKSGRAGAYMKSVKHRKEVCHETDKMHVG